jgi:hypothetical protein
MNLEGSCEYGVKGERIGDRNKNPSGHSEGFDGV